MGQAGADYVCCVYYISEYKLGTHSLAWPFLQASHLFANLQIEKGASWGTGALFLDGQDHCYRG